MIAGHASLVFIIASITAFYAGKEAEKSLTLGLFAAAFAILPDLDMLFFWKDILFILSSGFSGFVEAFWEASDGIHRGLSHSLVTLVFAVSGFSFYRFYPDRKVVAAVLVSLVSYSFFVAGIVPAFMTLIMVAAGLLITEYSRGLIDKAELTIVSALGLISHSFGDVFTGTPPEFLFPFNFSLLESRIVLSSDPTINFLSIFFLELILVIVALLAAMGIKDVKILRQINVLALTGFIYSPVFFFISEPKLSNPYVFVFSTVGLGLIVGIYFYLLRRPSKDRMEEFLSTSLNITLTVFLALLSYTLLFLLF